MGGTWKKKGLEEPHEKFLGLYIPCKYVEKILMICESKNISKSDVMRLLIHFAFKNGFAGDK